MNKKSKTTDCHECGKRCIKSNTSIFSYCSKDCQVKHEGVKYNNNISHHHGTCDMCGKRNTLIVMFGYNTQKDGTCYCICKNCLAENIQQIIYGFHSYMDGLID